MGAYSDLVPTNWLDSLLTGPKAVLRGEPGTWGCRDIERLLQAVRARIHAEEVERGLPCECHDNGPEAVE